MTNYRAPLDDMNFLLSDVFDFNKYMSELTDFNEVDTDLAIGILEECGKFCTEILEPLNIPGDEEGCRLENGSIITPAGFSEANTNFVEGGWPGLSGDPEYGGQGLPQTLQILVDEMISSANMSFGLFAGLTRGAAEAINHHASLELKQKYLPKMISGEWTGVMCLTEASAGSDLGLLTTKAIPQTDGSYKIMGSKIFISSGDHDFGGNIVHLVLARLPDAPEGTKGISMFLVPKFQLNDDGSLGETNAVSVGSIEHKMGIHGQPTCVINYDNSTGWLVGEPNRGLNAMFTMMNAERLYVGIQALGIAEAAYQKALAYAYERLQGRSVDGVRSPVPIIEHPDVKKMLLTIRSFTEAARALSIWTALQMDIATHHFDETIKQKSSDLVSLLTPVLKASMSDYGFQAAVVAQQVFGGHGYVKEWGMEQYVRDARITQIYEGTNGIQAMDLVTRKLTYKEGQLPIQFFNIIKNDIESCKSFGEIRHISNLLENALSRLEKTTVYLQENKTDLNELGAAATEYLELFALVSYGWMWMKMACKAHEKSHEQPKLFLDKLVVAEFFIQRILPKTLALETSILAGSKTVTKDIWS